MMLYLRELFGVEVGIADHMMDVGVAGSSVDLGALMVEKHFTFLRAEGGVDSLFSVESHELKSLAWGLSLHAVLWVI